MGLASALTCNASVIAPVRPLSAEPETEEQQGKSYALILPQPAAGAALPWGPGRPVRGRR